MIKKDNLNSSLKDESTAFKVFLKRDSSIESVHRVHAVICDIKGRVLMHAGKSDYLTFIRSALKPFQALPFISSGAYEMVDFDEKLLAIACGSHSGEKYQSRQSFKLLWNSDLTVDQLQCPIPVAKESKLEHNCSGKHAAFLATCKKMNWPMNTYLEETHPIQIEINRRVSEILDISTKELVIARDNCGAPTLLLSLSQMASLYAHLTGSNKSELEQISRAMMRNPELVAGKGKFDTEVIKSSHGQLLSKGGSEGIQCLSKIGEGIGIAIKAEDGSRRAKHAVALHLLENLDWITPVGLQDLKEDFLRINPFVNLQVEGSLKFQEN